MKISTAGISHELLIQIPLKTILRIFQGGIALGYISAETTLQVDGPRITLTPFTSEGTLPETLCTACAVQALLQHRAGIKDFLPCDRRPEPRGIIIGIIAARAVSSPFH